MSFSNINLVEDLCPVSEFRSEFNSVLQKVKTNHRPVVLTQHGKSTAVVMDIYDYQDLIYERELLQDIRLGVQESAEGKTLSSKEAKERVLQRLQNDQG